MATIHIKLTEHTSEGTNYNSVDWETFTIPDDMPVRTIVRRVKKLMGVTGRHETSDNGDVIYITPYRSNLLLTIIFTEAEPFSLDRATNGYTFPILEVTAAR